MVCPRKEHFQDGGEGEDLDRRDGVDEEGQGSGGIDRSRPSGSSVSAEESVRASAGPLERLTDVLRGGGDGDLLFDCGEAESGMLQWLQALDLQVMGACRADERLKPLLKFNASGCVAEDRLISQLSQHFEVTEVGTLARCLCVPLVSVRVGRINKERNLLCPTTTRGFLRLHLLPSSDMRLLFCGDDGVNEKLVVVNHRAENPDVTIEEIPADSAGRSFLLRLPVNRISYFWCSEKSKLMGSELLTKMKDLVRRRPSISQLTGISELRLDAFATHLRAYLLRSSNSVEANSGASSTIFVENASGLESEPGSLPSSTISRSSHTHLSVGQSGESHPACQSGPSKFKDGLVKSAISLRNVTRVKLRQHRENNISLLADDSPPIIVSTSCMSCTSSTTSRMSQGDDKFTQHGESFHKLPFNFPEMTSLGCPSSFTPFSFGLTPSQVPGMNSSHFSPYYCWCPPAPCTSSCQNTATRPQLSSMASESMLLQPLSSVLSNVGSSVPFGVPKPALNLSEIPTLDLPSIFPLSSPFVSIPSAQQIPTFTPFMSDPIVHIPVIDVCSSGQGYLVSAGPAISSAVPPLFPSIVNPLIPEAESAAEKNARETLRMLMASAPTNPQLIKVLPAVLSTVSEDFSCVHGMNHGALVVGSRGLYSGTKDVDAATNCVCSTGIAPSVVPKMAAPDHYLKNEMPIHTREDNMEDLVLEGCGCAEEETASD
uniref:Uncharacterized protein n=3 Tax=Anthurium amnicola TaxID=1678845 RepID=A0A1D1YQR4_9ARAE